MEAGTNNPWMKLWERGKKIGTKKVFHLTHKENIEETKGVLRKLGRLSLPLKYSIGRPQGQWKKWCRIGRKWRQYYGIESNQGIETLRTMFRMTPEYLMFYCFSLVFFLVFVVFQGKL